MPKRKHKSSSAGTITLCCNDCREFETVARYTMNRAAGARCSKCGGRLVRVRELAPGPLFERDSQPRTEKTQSQAQPDRPSKAEKHSRSEFMGTNAGQLLRWFQEHAPTVMLTFEDGAWMVAADDYEGWVVAETPEDALVMARNRVEESRLNSPAAGPSLFG